MGIIQRQSIKGTIYSYIGVGLGFVISGLLFPRFLSTEEIGLLRILVSYSVILAQFSVLGINAVTVKLFPYFRDNAKKHHGYLGLALLVSLVGSVLALGFYLSLHNYLIEHAGEKSRLFIQYYYYVIPLFVFTVMFNIFDTYYRVLYNAVRGTVYKEVIQRVLIIFSIGLFYFGMIDFREFVVLYILAFIIPAILLGISLAREHQLFLKPDWSYLDKKMLRSITGVAFFGLITSYSGVLIMNIDSVMIDHYLGLSQTGIYTITFFFGTLIMIPARSMAKISAVVIADAWKSNDRETIFNIYKKTTLTLSIAGIFIFIGIWANIGNVFKILGKDYEAGKYVILFIGLANLVEMYMGAASHIIVNSPKYKWLSYLLAFYTVLIITTNMIFIPKYGITGAAFASFISRIIYGFMRFLVLYYYYKYQPYELKHLLLILVGACTWYVSTRVPEMDHFIVDLLVRSTIITIIFVPVVYLLKISEDLNRIILKIVKRN